MLLRAIVFFLFLVYFYFSCLGAVKKKKHPCTPLPSHPSTTKPLFKRVYMSPVLLCQRFEYSKLYFEVKNAYNGPVRICMLTLSLSSVFLVANLSLGVVMCYVYIK